MDSKCKRYIIPSFLALFFVLLTASSASAYEGCRNDSLAAQNYSFGGSADWNLSDGTITCTNLRFNLSGNVTISKGAKLVLGNVTITFNDSINGVHNKTLINVSNGSSFNVLNSSNITVYGETSANNNRAINNISYSLLIENNSIVYINDSTIEYTANFTQAGGEVYGFYSTGFLEIYNSTIRKAFGYALRVNGSMPKSTWAATGSLKINHTKFFESGRGLLFYNTTIAGGGIDNTNISDINEPFELEANHSNVSLRNTTLKELKFFSSAPSYITISFPVVFRIRNSYWHGQDGSAAPVVIGATVVLNASANASYANTTFSATDSNGLTNMLFVTAYRKNNANSYVYGNYSVNVTSSLGNFSDNRTANGFYINITNASDGLSTVNLTVYEVYNNVSLTPAATADGASAGSIINVTIVVNNTGNGGVTGYKNYAIFAVTSNASDLWSISFTNSSINLTNETTQTFRARINIPSSAVPGKAYLLNISAAVSGRSGTSREASFTYTLTVNNSTSSLNIGKSIQNASDFLDVNLSHAGNNYGSWNHSNYTTAWALWGYTKMYGANTSLVYNVTSRFNASQNALGFWTDNAYDGNLTTALVILAYKNNSYADAPAASNNYTNITKAVEYLQNQKNQSTSTRGYQCWPNDTCDAFNTSVTLSALFKATTTNTSLAKNATAWLLQNQSSDGSWNRNLTHTSWAVYALYSSNLTDTFTSSGASYTITYNKTNATKWLKNQQQIEGYFGSDRNIVDTALAVIALNAAGETSWTVDVDQDSTTTNDQYTGSIRAAVDWIFTKQESYGASGAGGWGTSPADARVTGMGLLAVGGYGTITGSVLGAGNSNGFAVRNATVWLGSYNTTVNNAGEYSLNVPAGTYALSANHSLFETNGTNTSVTISAGQNITQNLTMMPSIEILGFRYGTGNFYSETSGAWTAGVAYIINGTARYKYNVSQGCFGTFKLDNNQGAAGLTVASTVYHNSTFEKTGLTAPSPSSTTTYILTLTVYDNYSVSASSALTMSIAGTGSNVVNNPVSGGEGGGTTKAEYAISVTSFDGQISVIQGQSTSSNFVIKNNGLKTLKGVKVEVIGIPESWYSSKVSSSGLATQDLATGESASFEIKFSPPADAEPKTYTVTLKAKDKDGLAIAEKKVTFKVTKVWDTTKIDALSVQIEEIKGDFSEAKADVKVLEAKGIDVTSMNADVTAFATAIQNAITKYNAGEYTEAEQYYKEALTLLEKIKSAAASAQPPATKVAKWLSGLSLSIISISVIVVLIGAVVGFIIWYKMFRVITISEIKKDPAIYSEGARIEGVVKSITETTKGKVFLVQDHTEKLHVRYPYYTTTEVGNLIRAVGAVKTYKDVPYMDATDLHRVTVKHFGGIAGGHGGFGSFVKRFKH